MPTPYCRWNKAIHAVTLLALLCGDARSALAQGTRSDYERAAKLYDQTRNKVFRWKAEPHWFGSNSARFWYRNDLPDQAREFIVVDAERASRVRAFDHERLAAGLTSKLGKDVVASRLPFETIEFVEDGAAIRFNIESKGWKFVLATNELTEAEPLKKDEAAKPQRPGRQGRGGRRGDESPDGSKTVVARGHNLFVKLKDSGEEIALTTDGSAEDAYEAGVVWSPDSTKFVALKTKPAQQHIVHFVESSPQDQVQPKLHSFDYLKPGDRIAHPRPCLFDVTAVRGNIASAATPINVSAAIRDDLFPTPWSIDEIRWSADSQRFTFAYNQRGHQVLRIIAVEAETRVATMLINEESKTFVDYAGKRFVHYADDANEIIWMSERDGWNHLYLYDLASVGWAPQPDLNDANQAPARNDGSFVGKATDGRTGRPSYEAAPITRGEWVVRGVDLVDEEHRQVWFRASGVFPGQDPYYLHFGRVNFDGSGLTWLTAGDGTHSVEYSPDRRFLIDTYSRIDQPPIIELRKVAGGSLVCELECADASALLATGWKMPERFVAKARDGQTDIFGVIWRPTNFDPEKKYPVIEHIYAGPHSAFVPKSFSSYHPPQALAELGFVVVQMDGLGTSHRSKAFHDVCWKNLGDSGFPDRILWIKAAAAKYSQLDIGRVGIYGGSAGGQSSTRAMLAHGDFYKVAVSDCGCHDNRMDKIWWNELWMSHPVGEHYAEQSNVTHAHKLQGKLLLVVGELDRNVDPASTMQVASALVKADKDFDLLIIPGAGHGAAESPYGKRRRMDFFVRHLLGVEPRSRP